MESKPTLQQIRQRTKTADGHILTRQLIAEKAGLAYGEVYVLDVSGQYNPQGNRIYGKHTIIRSITFTAKYSRRV